MKQVTHCSWNERPVPIHTVDCMGGTILPRPPRPRY